LWFQVSIYRTADVLFWSSSAHKKMYIMNERTQNWIDWLIDKIYSSDSLPPTNEPEFSNMMITQKIVGFDVWQLFIPPFRFLDREWRPKWQYWTVWQNSHTGSKYKAFLKMWLWWINKGLLLKLLSTSLQRSIAVASYWNALSVRSVRQHNSQTSRDEILYTYA
jgi:hypothetical protein